ncbi:MAG: ATP-binding protein [bacterium]
MKILKFLQHLSINAKVALAYLGFVIIISGAGSMLVVYNEKSVIRQGHIDLVRNLAENTQPVLLVEHRMMLNRLVQTVGKMPDVRSCAIMNKNNLVVAHTDMAMIGRILLVGEPVMESFKKNGYYFEIFGKQFENVYVPVYSSGRYIGNVFVGFDAPSFVRLFRRPGRATIESILIVILSTALLGLIGAFIIARLISYPIRILTKKVYNVHQGKIPERHLPKSYVYCWEQLDCKQVQCPSYGNKAEKCWAVAGTFCRGKVQGVFAQKIGDCRNCIVFKKNSGDEVEQLNDAFDIMVLDLVDNTQKAEKAKMDMEKYASQLEDANRENVDLKAYTERILNSLSSAVISLDENMVIRKYNRTAQSLLGLDLESLVGRGIAEIPRFCSRCNDFFGLILRALESYKKQGRPIIGQEVSVTRADGERMTISLSVLPLHGDPALEKTPMIVTFEDITDKEKMREELTLSRQLAELGEVAAKVAHDIRNPLNVIAGGVHYLKTKYVNDSEILNMSNLISGQVERLNNVTSGLLKVSKPMMPHYNTCDFNRLVDESSSFLLEEINLAGLRLEKDLDKDIPPLVLDTNQIQRVIINLMENAIEAMLQGGTITIRTRYLQNGGRSDEQVELCVLDTGPGIPDEIVDSVFKPFYTTKVHGTGLGLAIVRQIVTQHRGQARIRRREPGPGTEVLILLPVKTLQKDMSHVHSSQHPRD